MKTFLKSYGLGISVTVILTFLMLHFLDGDIRNELILPGAPVGSQDKISVKSQEEILKILSPKRDVMGVWVGKTQYSKLESPVVWHDANNKKFVIAINDYISRQHKGLIFSSKELDNFNSTALRNTMAAQLGDISCAPIKLTEAPLLIPKALDFANVICRAPIPPFPKEANLAILLLLDLPLGIEDPKLEQIRNLIVRVQLDIFNRDFLSREIWN